MKTSQVLFRAAQQLSMSEHTKDASELPWRVIGDNGYAIWSGNEIIFSATTGRSGKLAKNNARLIVRAVNSYADLLAALQRMLDVYLTPHPRTERMEADAQARIAIAKATAQ